VSVGLCLHAFFHRVPVNVSFRPRTDSRLFRVSRTGLAASACFQTVANPLMVLSRSLKLSEPVFASYWLEATPAVAWLYLRTPTSLGINTAPYSHRNGYSSLTFRSPLEFDPTGPAHCWAPLIRFCFPLARSNSRPHFPGLPFLVCSAYRFSQPHSGFLRELPGGPISCL
jgi:hypothetical protein